MSSLQSDPQFPRGTTLLAGADIELVNGLPIAGRDVVGQIKVFQDVDPQGVKNSNRLVYCVAARVATATALTAKDVVKFSATNIIEDVDGKGDTTAGQIQGVVDEYIPSTLTIRQNDIVWVVVQGPTTAKFLAAAVAAGAVVQGSATAGSLQAGAGFGVTLATKASTVLEGRVLVTGTNIA